MSVAPAARAMCGRPIEAASPASATTASWSVSARAVTPAAAAAATTAAGSSSPSETVECAWSSITSRLERDHLVAAVDEPLQARVRGVLVEKRQAARPDGVRDAEHARAVAARRRHVPHLGEGLAEAAAVVREL